MNTEIGALSFSIDSREALTAVDALDRLQRQAGSTAQASQALSRETGETQRALRDLAQQAQMSDMALRQTAQGLDGLLQRVQLLSREVGVFRASTQDLNTALGQLRAAGELFGTSATGIESFVRASRSIGQTSFETVQALQRITQALEGTTVAGERARRVLREYGVQTDGRGAEDAGQVLREFVGRLRQTRPDALRNEEIFAVLGPQSIETMAAISSESYRSIGQRRRSDEANTLNPLALQVQLSNATRQQRVGNQRAEYDDLLQEFGTQSERAAGGVSIEQLRARQRNGQRAASETVRVTRDPQTGQIREDWGDAGWGSLLMGSLGLSNNMGLGGYFGARRELLNDPVQQALRQQIEDQFERRRLDIDQSGGSWFSQARQRLMVGRERTSQLEALDGGWFSMGGRYRFEPEQVQRSMMSRWVNFGMEGDTAVRNSSMSPLDQQMRQMMLGAMRQAGNIDLAGMDQLSPEDILMRLRTPAGQTQNGLTGLGRMDAVEAILQRIAQSDQVQVQREEFGRRDRDVMRRSLTGGLTSADAFGVNLNQLGLDGDPMTSQEAAERAQAIAQAIIRIRATFKGEEERAAELRRVAEELDRDQSTRDRRAQAQAEDQLSQTVGRRARMIDVNPANRLSNIREDAYERAINAGRPEMEANTIALRALTEATISLERSTNEALRDANLGVAAAYNRFNSLMPGSAFQRQPGLSVPDMPAALSAPRGASGGSDTAPPLDPSRPLADQLPGSPSGNVELPPRPGAGASHGERVRWAAQARRAVANANLSPDQYAAAIATINREANSSEYYQSSSWRNNPQWMPNRGRGEAPGGGMPAPEAALTFTVTAAAPRGGDDGVLIPDLRGFRVADDQAGLREQLYGATRNRFRVEQRVDAMVAGGRAAGESRDALLERAFNEEGADAIGRYAEQVIRASEAHRDAMESLRGTTTAERELIRARQEGERSATMLRAAAQGTSDPTLRRQLLQAADGAVEQNEGRARQGLSGRFSAMVRDRGLDLEEERAAGDDWWRTGANQARLRAQRMATRQARDQGQLGTPDGDRLIEMAGETAQLAEIRRQNQLVRDSFLDMGNAATSALSQIILRGGDARQVIGALLSDLAAMAFRRATFGLAERAFEGVMSSVRGEGGGEGGWGLAGRVASTAASAGSGLWSGISSVASSIGGFFGFAQGGVMDGGRVLEHPTFFPLAGGGRGLAAEAGNPEAVLPLKRDSSGRLGISAPGIGGGTSISVTVNNHGSGSSQDPDQARKIAAEVQRALEEAQSRKMLEEMRVGGMLNPL